MRSARLRMEGGKCEAARLLVSSLVKSKDEKRVEYIFFPPQRSSTVPSVMVTLYRRFLGAHCTLHFPKFYVATSPDTRSAHESSKAGRVVVSSPFKRTHSFQRPEEGGGGLPGEALGYCKGSKVSWRRKGGRGKKQLPRYCQVPEHGWVRAGNVGRQRGCQMYRYETNWVGLAARAAAHSITIH